jgi:hypothetical protein
VHGWLTGSGGVAHTAIKAYARVLEETDYTAFLCEQPETVKGTGGADYKCYQNLGVYGFDIADITNTAFDPAKLDASIAAAASHSRHVLTLLERASGWLSDEWMRLFNGHPLLLIELVRALLMVKGADLMVKGADLGPAPDQAPGAARPGETRVRAAPSRCDGVRDDGTAAAAHRHSAHR